MTPVRSPRSSLIILISILASAVYSSARVQTGFLDRTVEISGKSYRYQVYVPIDFRSKKSWPVILFLHGSGERGSDGLRQTNVGLPRAIRGDRSRFPFVVVIPQCSDDSIWSTPAMEAQAMAALLP